ncbi:DUF2917 domain-containing protein [Variovorax sp. HJSM1_2]|uniref:DUF2917 domain-containing protein n=1 Tax=Variovorax sp. HJSM1_2 TaxID=3366263 RepID=UPI003BE66C54
MEAQTQLESQQSLPVTALAGCWKLDAGRATTLQPQQAGVFRVAHGAVWITFNDPRAAVGAGNGLGDHILYAGEQIKLPAGQKAVVEPWALNGASQAAAYFSWTPEWAAARSSDRSPGLVAASAQGSVAQPMRDLGVALGLAAGALGRLAMALVGARSPGRATPAVVRI